MKDLFEETISILRNNGINHPRLEARMIFGAVINKDYSTVSGCEDVDSEQELVIREYLNKRLSGWPLDKIFGKKSFYKYDFIVNENVLSPRPDTEILVEAAVKIAQEYDFKNVLDMGTGSGCILLSILAECKNMQGVGVDISSAAIEVAQKNASLLGVEKRALFVNKNWNDTDFFVKIGQKFDIIVTNPPYIALSEEKDLMPEVRNHDPKEALFAGKDGLEEYRNLAKILPEMMNKNAFLLTEIGINQGDSVENIFVKEGFSLEKAIFDLSGIERCLVFKK